MTPFKKKIPKLLHKKAFAECVANQEKNSRDVKLFSSIYHSLEIVEGGISDCVTQSKTGKNTGVLEQR